MSIAVLRLGCRVSDFVLVSAETRCRSEVARPTTLLDRGASMCGDGQPRGREGVTRSSGMRASGMPRPSCVNAGLKVGVEFVAAVSGGGESLVGRAATRSRSAATF